MEMSEQSGLATIYMHMGMPNQHHTSMSLASCGTMQPIFLPTSIGMARHGRANGCTISVKAKGCSGKSTKARSSGPTIMAASCLYIPVSDWRGRICLLLNADPSDNWMNNKVLAKVAYTPTGPWSDPVMLYQATPITNGSSIYAAVPHPYYDESGKNLVVTFTNHPNLIQAVNVVSPRGAKLGTYIAANNQPDIRLNSRSHERPSRESCDTYTSEPRTWNMELRSNMLCLRETAAAFGVRTWFQGFSGKGCLIG